MESSRDDNRMFSFWEVQLFLKASISETVHNGYVIRWEIISGTAISQFENNH